MQYQFKIISLLSGVFLFADPPNWQDDPGCCQGSAYIIGGIVQIEGNNVAGGGDMFAAFNSNGDVRGLAISLTPNFGPYAGQIVYEMTMRSNNPSEILSFKYYDASEDAIFGIVETYEFVSNDQIGSITNPFKYNFKFVTLSFTNSTYSSVDIHYQSNAEIAGFQFELNGINIDGTSGGAASDAGLTITISNNMVLGFSLSGSTIPVGSGTLFTLEFTESDDDRILEMNNVVISGSNGSAIPTSGPGSIEISCSNSDCAGVCGGSYVADECGVCGGSGEICNGVCPVNGLCANGTPGKFQFTQSTLQAFYFFQVVTINEVEIEPSDWVGVFKASCSDPVADSEAFCDAIDGVWSAEICVGSRKWETSQCNSGICDIPLMGDDGNAGTEGYMTVGDIPIFKIYDASKNLYYEATPAENVSWSNNGAPILEYLIAEVSISGCIDPTACNYDASATEDDGSCTYPEENFDCDGNCFNIDECGICGGDNVNCENPDNQCFCSGCTDIDACNYTSDAAVDNGSCWYKAENYDCDGNCVIEIDCAGICGGNTIEDECGICGGNNSTCTDCAGVVQGSAYIDLNCGNGTICVGGTSNNLACEQDCIGTWGGSATTDGCGICDADTANDDTPSTGICDCADPPIPNGEALIDGCGDCVGGNTGKEACAIDCAGKIDGTAFYNNCATCLCNGSTAQTGHACVQSEECVKGCDGMWKNDGTHSMSDDCGVCDNNLENDNVSCTDCNGDLKGEAILDRCGICSGGNSEHIACIGNGVCTEEDCAGVCEGGAEIDHCGICDGYCFGDLGNECDNNNNGSYDTTCDGNCVASELWLDENGLDCVGECDGPVTPTFNCFGELLCNPADCILDIHPHLLPSNFGINKIFPNPFNPVTRIQYDVSKYALVMVRVFNIQGREVAQLLNEYQNPGQYQISWDASNHASGMYIVNMIIRPGDDSAIFKDLRKILYLK